MPKGRMAPEAIYAAVQEQLARAEVTGEKLNGTLLARRVGCGRTVLYTNLEIRGLLLSAGIIEDTPSQPASETKNESPPSEIREQSVLERRLRKAEDRASRLELLLAEAQEHNRTLQAENDSLQLRIRMVSEGRSVL